jgi:glycosyltransferase involved in cell wall biosynthesis
MLSALAVICIRNEAVHVRRCLSDFIRSGIEVHLIDNGSTDGSIEIAKDFLGRGLIGIEHLPWTGDFSLSDQLRAKERVIAKASHDWIIHADADEWLCSPVDGQSLLDGIVEADAEGCTAVNFHEIVFVPLSGEDFDAEDYSSRMSNYYFFQPNYPRLNRAWNRRANLTNARAGGHKLSGDGLKLFGRDFILRHYIALSEEQARKKYLGRRFSDEDLRKGWHGNRATITQDKLRMKRIPGLKHTANPGSNQFDLSTPLRTHFWEW